ncbi:MAG TPA: PBP1A family penicillin-binding protein [Spirochaetota bacterium]|nr:PBP1A family penicillin-binding protein [Spirochaetota bacterium]
MTNSDRTKTVIRTAIAITIGLLLLAPLGYFLAVYFVSHEEIRTIKPFNPALSTKLYDAHGVLISELYDEKRSYADLSAIPPVVRAAFLSAEDRGFYRHRGIDPLSVLRALVVDIAAGEIRQGGSTITQQLVKQLYTGRERTIRRKIVELLLAGEIEKKFNKDRILEMYLNQVYFGHGVYGVQSAARFYFDKDARALTPIEAAVLASIPAAPRRFSPLVNPRNVYEKSKGILYTMIQDGHVEKSTVNRDFDGFWATFLASLRLQSPTASVRQRGSDRAPQVTEHVRRLLVAQYGEETVYRGGLSVYTTFDLNAQDIAQRTLSEGVERQRTIAARVNAWKLAKLEKEQIAKRTKAAGNAHAAINAVRRDLSDSIILLSDVLGVSSIAQVAEDDSSHNEEFIQSSRVEGALISIDPRTGAIVAVVGGSDTDDANQLNRAFQSLRQPGSAFKPFVYGAGLESKKITAATSFLDSPTAFEGVRKSWTPTNYNKSYSGKVLVRKALSSSLNVVSVLAYDEIGGDRIAKFSGRLMGLPDIRFDVNPTLALGTTEVSPYEIALGFAVFANGGKSVRPYCIRYILDRHGKRINDTEAEIEKIHKKQLVHPGVSYILTDLLRSVVDSGTGHGPIRRAAGFRLPAAGKTGTNSDFKDAWFVGYTADMVTAVWVGCDSPKFTLGHGQSGAVAAAPIWGSYMKSIYATRKPAPFPRRPKGITYCTVCTKTGMLPVPGCASRTEIFLEGTQPTDSCSLEHDDPDSVFELARKRKARMIERETGKNSREDIESLNLEMLDD